MQRLLAKLRTVLSLPTPGGPTSPVIVLRRGMLACLPMLMLTGCLKHTRLLERPQAPAVVQTATPQQLIQQLDERFDAIHSMNARVLIRASVGGVDKGKETDYTSIRGYILLRQPSMLRVLGMLPVIETRAFDMVSNGNHFTLLIPPKSLAITGTGSVAIPSSNPLMNLRPAVFYDSMLIKKVEPDDLVYVTSDTGIVRDPRTHHLMAEPDYELGILRRIGTSQQLMPERVVHISRTNMLPFQQDEYDSDGILVTRTLYSAYRTFDGIPFPTKITINRPIDGYQLALTIQKLTFNHPLADDQFELKIPAGTKMQKLP
ncbi:MAG: outer membrane lipoprotein-sorting protein [Acidobacteriota bacterium]